MSCAKVLGAAQVCPAPLTCLMVLDLALFCAQKPGLLRSLRLKHTSGCLRHEARAQLHSRACSLAFPRSMIDTV